MTSPPTTARATNPRKRLLATAARMTQKITLAEAARREKDQGPKSGPLSPAGSRAYWRMRPRERPLSRETAQRGREEVEDDTDDSEDRAGRTTASAKGGKDLSPAPNSGRPTGRRHGTSAPPRTAASAPRGDARHATRERRAGTNRTWECHGDKRPRRKRATSGATKAAKTHTKASVLSPTIQKHT